MSTARVHLDDWLKCQGFSTDTLMGYSVQLLKTLRKWTEDVICHVKSASII